MIQDNDTKYIKNLENEIEKTQKANLSIREFVDYIANDVKTTSDMISRICNQILSAEMIVAWLEVTEHWKFESRVSDARFERKIFTSTKKSGGSDKRISVITKVIDESPKKELQIEYTTSVYSALTDILEHAESNSVGKIRVITDIILGK